MKTLRAYKFTLIELLLALAILGIVGAIMLSGGTKARDAAKLTQCRHNLSQVQMLVELYKKDHKELPMAPGGAVDFSALKPYIEDQGVTGLQLFVCPGDHDNAGIDHVDDLKSQTSYYFMPSKEVLAKPENAEIAKIFYETADYTIDFEDDVHYTDILS